MLEKYPDVEKLKACGALTSDHMAEIKGGGTNGDRAKDQICL